MAGTGGKREGAGRPKGAPNKATAEIKALAQEYGHKAILSLAQMSGLVHGHSPADSETARIAAIKELLDRGYGKSAQAITGADGGKLAVLIEVVTGVPRAEDDDEDDTE